MVIYHKQMEIRLFRQFFIAIFVAAQLFTQLSLTEGQPGVAKGQPADVIDIQIKIPRNK